MDNPNRSQKSSINLSYVVPGLPFYSQAGEKLAECIYDCFNNLGCFLSYLKKRVKHYFSKLFL